MVSKRAFTIIELLVVIVIIGIISAIVVVGFSTVSQRALTASIQSDMTTNSKNLRLYFTENNSYPMTLNANGCPLTPVVSNIYCVKFTNNNTLKYYAANNGSLVQTFSLIGTDNKGTNYRIAPDNTVRITTLNRTSCLDIQNNSESTGNGIYWIQPSGYATPFSVYCDMTTDGGGWTVIQERYDGTVDFYQNWASYVAGFGTAGSGEYWLGLDKINSMTQPAKNLYVALTRYTGETAYAKYTSFSIGNLSTNYTLTISGYTGTAGNSLAGHNGFPFTTYDVDNDTSGGNCAVSYRGAWWYYNCHTSNLNGKYYGGPHPSNFADGMDWRDWLGYYEAVSRSRMMIK